ncbi:Aste57867_21999 [Aphanomyces stellatus]|uniref:Aste57867_21999 protein n=1 Tax=Aphanomyces stellatus TaxID=120398 RepID=A0A485LNX7_9STRA|nr:hypothetical protein As57867_021930 [Aphanomyces stellatus]VFT98667.1 Aste57867_21999 [Aphanomyces stellatus]
MFRSLLRAAKQFHAHERDNKSIYTAVRSCALMPYYGIRDDWKREQSLRALVDDFTPHHTVPWSDVVTAVRQAFTASSKLPACERLDRAFNTLRVLGVHNELILKHTEKGLFSSKRRSDDITFRVGDLVRIESVGRGVVCGWHLPRLKYANMKPKYMVLAHCRKGNVDDGRDRMRVYTVEASRLKPAKKREAIKNPALLFYFDGFDNGRHLPCAALAARYPDDVVSIVEPPVVPSILELQHADEPQLVQFLQSPNATVVYISKAVLEAKWMAEAGPLAKRELEAAMEVYAAGEKSAGRDRMRELVDKHPDYAAAIEMLAMVCLDDSMSIFSVSVMSWAYMVDKAEESLQLFQRVLELKPYHTGALSGVATSAAKLRQWDIAHVAAAKIMRIEPQSAIAKRVLSKVDEALYYMF